MILLLGSRSDVGGFQRKNVVVGFMHRVKDFLQCRIDLFVEHEQILAAEGQTALIGQHALPLINADLHRVSAGGRRIDAGWSVGMVQYETGGHFHFDGVEFRPRELKINVVVPAAFGKKAAIPRSKIVGANE